MPAQPAEENRATPGRPRRCCSARITGAAALLLTFAGPARSDVAADAKVSIDNFTFSPATVEVKQGQDVTWTNHDDIPHVVVIPGVGAKSKPLDTDDTYAFHFDKTGTFDYICGLHPAMRGKVIVR